jgi:hypothetical protein
MEVGGALTRPRAFSFNNSALAFKLFSSGIYNSKIEAILRELACNARDAHVAAGKADTPFEIHLPTAFDPTFRLNDFGTGLKYIEGGCKQCHGVGLVETQHGDTPCPDCDGTGDYDAVISLYCIYFASDKNDSNEFIGAMGIGSKSPFCYDEKGGGFSITNRYEGVTRIYQAAVHNGFPTVVLQSKEDTPDSPNGVEISLPVKIGDIWEFENKARSVFEFFSPLPIFNKEISINKQIYTIRTEKWGLRDNTVSTISGLRAIQGIVPYDVGDIDISRMNTHQRRISEMELDIFLPIGDLEVTASREFIQLDERTVGNILKALDGVHEGMLEEIKKKIDQCAAVWEARLQIYDLTSRGGSLGKIVNDAYNNGLLLGNYSHFTMSDEMAVVNKSDYEGIQLTQYSYNFRAEKRAKKESLFSFNAASVKNMRDRIAEDPTCRKNYDVRVEVEPKVAFVINDLKVSADKYIGYFLQCAVDRGGKTLVYCVNRQNKSVDMSTVMSQGLTMMEKLGNPPVTLASELKARYGEFVDTPREKGVAIPRQRRNVSVLVNEVPHPRRGSAGWAKAWDKADNDVIDLPGMKYYVITDGSGSGHESTGFYKAREFVRFVNSVRESNLLDVPVYGLKANSKLIEGADWKPYMPAVWAAVKKHMTPAREQRMTMVDCIGNFSTSWDFVFDYMTEHPMDAESPVQQFVVKLNKAKESRTKAEGTALQSVLQVAAARNKYTMPQRVVIDFGKKWDEVKEFYPMMKYTGRSSWMAGTIEEAVVVTNYFKLEDANREAQSSINDNIKEMTAYV